MCERCDSKVVAKKWVTWASIIVVLTIFILSQVFMYGKVIGVVQSHLDSKEVHPTHKQISDEFVDKDEFDTIKDMVKFLYEKEGGK